MQEWHGRRKRAIFCDQPPPCRICRPTSCFCWRAPPQAQGLPYANKCLIDICRSSVAVRLRARSW
jgi:hypothetical protein